MILISILWKTVRLKTVLINYMLGSLLVWGIYSYDPKGPISLIIIAHLLITYIACSLIHTAWQDVIAKRTERFPNLFLWLFSTVVTDIRTFEGKNSTDPTFVEMKNWCNETCNKGWCHGYGYFIFRSKHDALLFKMSWV